MTIVDVKPVSLRCRNRLVAATGTHAYALSTPGEQKSQRKLRVINSASVGASVRQCSHRLRSELR